MLTDQQKLEVREFIVQSLIKMKRELVDKYPEEIKEGLDKDNIWCSILSHSICCTIVAKLDAPEDVLGELAVRLNTHLSNSAQEFLRSL